MFQDPRTGDVSFFGDVPDHEDRDVVHLCNFTQFPSAFTHLGDRPGGGFQFIQLHGLDGVDDQELRLDLPYLMQYMVQAGFGQQ